MNNPNILISQKLAKKSSVYGVFYKEITNSSEIDIFSYIVCQNGEFNDFYNKYNNLHLYLSEIWLNYYMKYSINLTPVLSDFYCSLDTLLIFLIYFQV